MKKLLQKKVSTFIVTAMLFSASTNAQIVYTDVNPDSSVSVIAITGNPAVYKDYYLDLNNDANSDFILNVNTVKTMQSTYSSVSASPLNGNAVKDTLVSAVNVSIPLEFNAVIDSNILLQQSWQTSGSHKLRARFSGINSGLWIVGLDNYLGLRLLQSGQTYYGWVRLSVSMPVGGPGAFATVNIRDYAYNSIPNQPILAGQTVATGIFENSFASSINLFPNPANNHVTITLGSNSKKVEVTITDITGKIIYSTTASETQKVEVNTEDFAAGVYVVQIQTADFIETKKLVVEK